MGALHSSHENDYLGAYHVVGACPGYYGNCADVTYCFNLPYTGIITLNLIRIHLEILEWCGGVGLGGGGGIMVHSTKYRFSN